MAAGGAILRPFFVEDDVLGGIVQILQTVNRFAVASS